MTKTLRCFQKALIKHHKQRAELSRRCYYTIFAAQQSNNSFSWPNLNKLVTPATLLNIRHCRVSLWPSDACVNNLQQWTSYQELPSCMFLGLCCERFVCVGVALSFCQLCLCSSSSQWGDSVSVRSQTIRPKALNSGKQNPTADRLRNTHNALHLQ